MAQHLRREYQFRLRHNRGMGTMAAIATYHWEDTPLGTLAHPHSLEMVHMVRKKHTDCSMSR